MKSIHGYFYIPLFIKKSIHGYFHMTASMFVVRAAQENRLKTGTRVRHSTRHLKYLINSKCYFCSWRFMVELMGLSTHEKLDILQKIRRVDFDRAKSLKFIQEARKLRYFLLLLLTWYYRFAKMSACVFLSFHKKIHLSRGKGSKTEGKLGEVRKVKKSLTLIPVQMETFRQDLGQCCEFDSFCWFRGILFRL